MKIEALVEQTCLKPNSSLKEIDESCLLAIKHGFAAVCVPPLFVKKAIEFTRDSEVNVATVVGFPFGYSAIEAKLAEIVLAIIDGAHQIEMVINLAALKNNDWQYLANEINSIMPVVKSKNTKMAVIIEATILTKEEIMACCDLYGAAGVDYIKTSTGFAPKEVTNETVSLIRNCLATTVQIKVAGQIKNIQAVNAFIQAGANRISTEFGLELVKEIEQLN